MSYSLRIIKDADGIRLDEGSLSGSGNLPEGVLTISGHHVGDGEIGIENIVVQMTGATGGPDFYASSASTFGVDRRKPSAEA